MSARSLFLNNQVGASQVLGDAVSWQSITAGSLNLNQLVVNDLYANLIHSGGEDQVPDVYYYGSVNMTATYAGNAGGLVSTVTFPSPLYDGLPGDPLAPSVQLTQTLGTVPAATGIPPSVIDNTNTRQGYLAPQAQLFQTAGNAGQVNGIYILCPSYFNAAVSGISAYGTGAPSTFKGAQYVSWYIVGVPPQQPPSPWNTFQLPVGAYDVATNPYGWKSYAVGGGGYSSCVIPIGTPAGSALAGLVGADPGAVNIKIGQVVLAGAYVSAAAEAVDFPFWIRPVAPVTPTTTSPQVPCPTNPSPVDEFWIQAVTARVPPNTGGGTTGAQVVNITQALMLSAQGNNGLTQPFVTSQLTGIRLRIFTNSTTSRTPDGPLFIQVLMGWTLLDPTLTTPIPGSARNALTNWYGPQFFKVAPTINIPPLQTSFVPQVTLYLGCSSGVAGGGIGTSPLSVNGTIWSTNEESNKTKLYQITFGSVGNSTTYYTGNPNFFTIPTPYPPGVGASNANWPNGYNQYPIGSDLGPPTQPASAVSGWSNSRGTFQLI